MAGPARKPPKAGPDQEAEAEGRAHETEGLGPVFRRRHIRYIGIGRGEAGRRHAVDYPANKQPGQAGRKGHEQEVDGQTEEGNEQDGPPSDPV